jgi:methyltransferase-like protein/cyclopropane fatty-acyl-phospholipid synthase-like methyltransferase
LEKVTNLPRNSYDQIPYMGLSHSLTHPDILATTGTLLGLNPPNIQNCRVLELGCGNGSNLIPMALSLPGSQFFGLDSSRVQIRQGQQAIEKLGLRNIRLKHMNLLEVEASLGQFAYIMVHGVFSWVSEQEREKILTICDQNLAPEGIAYISYNTFPGWHQQKIVRDMLRYHTRNIDDPHNKIDRARRFLNFMAISAESLVKQSESQLGETYVNILKHENERLGKSADAYLFHEELEERNDPLYFYQFADLARRHNLQYLSESSLSQVFMDDVPLEIKNNLVKMSGDIIELEQYRDFLTNRSFRSSLVIHNDLKISRQINADRILNLYAGSSCTPESPDPDIHSQSAERFVDKNGAKLVIDHPLTKAALLYLSRIWPQVVALDDLLKRAYELLGKASLSSEAPIPSNTDVTVQDIQTIVANLLRGFVASPFLVELHVYAPRFATHLSDYPVASPWALYQLTVETERRNSINEKKSQPFIVTNLRHESVELKSYAPYVLHLLDGNCHRNELLTRLNKTQPDSNMMITDLTNNKPAGQLQPDLINTLDEDLQWLLRAALLIS